MQAMLCMLSGRHCKPTLLLCRDPITCAALCHSFGELIQQLKLPGCRSIAGVKGVDRLRAVLIFSVSPPQLFRSFSCLVTSILC